MKSALGRIRAKIAGGNNIGATLFLFGLNVVIVVLDSWDV